MTPSDVLRGAAQLLKEEGWTQHAFLDAHGRMCVTGAINRAANGGALYVGAEDNVGSAAWRALADKLGCRVTDWNDTPGRTAEEVISTLESLADDLEGKR